MSYTLGTTPSAGEDLEAFDLTQLLEIVRKLTNWSILGTFAATLATASTSFVSLGGTSSISFTKLGDAATSNILVFVSVQGFKTTATATVQFAVSDGTNSRISHQFSFNTLAEHMEHGLGVATMTGLAAGTYTLQAQGLVTTAVAGAYTINSGDNLSMLAMEVSI